MLYRNVGQYHIFIGDKLKSLLQFFTGEENISTTCTLKATLTFHDGIFPTASTCSLELSLPTSHRTYSEFECAMDKAMAWHGGFGCY